MPLVIIPNGIALNRRTHDPLAKQPNAFLEAASLWNHQGRRIDKNTGLCVWFTESKPIKQHIGGRHYKIVGWTDPVLGE